MNSEHLIPSSLEKSLKHHMLDDKVREKFDEIAALHDHTEAEEPTYEKLLEPTKQVHDIGEVALEATGVVVEPPSSMTTEQRFWNTPIPKMEAMTDEEIIGEFYRPDELPAAASPQEKHETTVSPMETKAPPAISEKEQTPSFGPEVYKDFSNEQLEQIKANLLDSLTETLSGMPDERRYGLEAVPGETDLERISQNLINITLESQRRSPEKAPEKPSSQDGRVYSATRLPSNDLEIVIDRLPKDRKVILPIYRLYVRLMNRADHAPAEEKGSLLDKATMFDELAAYLMIRKASGWDDVYVSRLRQMQAFEHPELNDF